MQSYPVHFILINQSRKTVQNETLTQFHYQPKGHNSVECKYQVRIQIQFSSVAQSCPTLCDPMDCSMPDSLSLPISWSLPKFMSIDSVMPSNHHILCRPLLLLPSIFPSIRVFSNESALPIRQPKYGLFSFNISLSNEHPGLIFRMDWLDLLAVQGTLKGLLQHHSSKASILQLSLQSNSHIHTQLLEKPQP